MEIFDINNLKQPLKDGEMIDLSNENDMVELFMKENFSGVQEFFIQLNGKILSSTKRFRTFRDRVWSLVQERNLEFDN